MMFNYFFDVLLPIKMMFSTMNNVYPLSDDTGLPSHQGFG